MSDSSKQSTVRSRASTRSRSSSRRPDPKLEEEKVRAQLNLLYVEKQQVWIRLEPMLDWSFTVVPELFNDII